jgi:hypothetical protein
MLFCQLIIESSNMGKDGVSTNFEEVSLPDGVKAVCLLHYGIGGLAVLLGVLLLVGNPVLGIVIAILGGLLVQIAQGLRSFHRSAWRNAITIHGIDIGVGLLLALANGIGEHLVSILISGTVIIYLYSQRHLYQNDSE